jgi:hypothetical protein
VTASAVVLVALRASTLPVEARAFVAAVAEGEGGVDFNTLYSGGTLINSADAANIKTVGHVREWTGALEAFPAWSGATTAGGLISTAAGICQDTRTTFNAYAVQFKTADFLPESQIGFNWQLAQSRFAGMDLLTALREGRAMLISPCLVKTWPGGCDVNFPKRYVNNLTALQSAPPAPPSYALTISSQVDLAAQKIEQSYALADEKGTALPLTLKIMALAISVATPFLGICLLGGCQEHVVPRAKQIALAPGEKPKNFFEQNKPTFRIVPGPRGPLAVPVGERQQ